MKLLIFDLDLTLVNTTSCQDYLKTKAGRDAIVGLLDSGEVTTELYFPDTVQYINSLMYHFTEYDSDTLPIIISDSPKAYCEAILRQHGFGIDSKYIFGAAHKPCVNMVEIYETINSYGLDDKGPEECLVIGDSTRDIFFAHEIECPSIWAKWGYVETEHVFPFHSSKPTRTATSLVELRGFIKEYIAYGEEAFDYEKPNFKDDWNIEAVDINNFTEHQVEDIGYISHYVPEALSSNNQEYISTFFELHWTLKPAKDVPIGKLWRNVPQLFYKKDGNFTSASPLMRKAGIYKFKFKEWLEEQGITGKVLLVPVPSSVPAECNKTHTINLIAEWWEDWLNKLTPKPNFELLHHNLLIERFQPKRPAHATPGQRFIEDQLSTMGVFRGIIDQLPNDISAVVFLDDVVTSGQSINAMATIFREFNVVADEVPLYGYAFFKTHHPTPEWV
nr:HAD hydrolase-like protein [Moritella viscosa]SHO01351.1 Putative uncharacterized protein [Moritella viscosa]